MSAAHPPHEALYHYYCEFDACALLHRHARRDLTPVPEMVTNFLGVQIPPKVFPAILAPQQGTVEPLPDPGNWHADIAEWAAALLSVEQAETDYRIVELGCGWGCWLVNMGSAARARGLSVALIGIEGDRTHLRHAAEVLEINGFGPGEYSLHHGVAAAEPGVAIFPDPQAGAAGWGGAAVFSPDAATLARARSDPQVQVLDCLTLEDLSGGGPIDLLHIDIQGAEVDFVAGNLTQMAAHVRRVLIGTHSRVIEGRLIALLEEAGWQMEMERPAIMPLEGGRQRIAIDGVQMWRNPARLRAAKAGPR